MRYIIKLYDDMDLNVPVISQNGKLILVELTEEQAHQLKQNPNVKYIEKEIFAHTCND